MMQKSDSDMDLPLSLLNRWMASLRETIHPARVFYLVCRQLLNRNPKGAPAIQRLTNSGTANAGRFQSGGVRCWRVSGAA